MIHVIEKRAETDLDWNFTEGSSYSVPDGNYNRTVKVDPFPCYAHDLDVVRFESARSWNAFPIDREVTLCVIDREELGRTNGNTLIGCNYQAKKSNGDYEWTATISLFGKRIPIHPAMTRYLVAHEYGHVVRRFISESRGEDDGKLYGKDSLYGEYARLRGFVSARHYGGGTWHARVEELFANDFRILIVGAEVEFWPHPGFARPEGVPAIVNFWNEAKKLACWPVALAS